MNEVFLQYSGLNRFEWERQAGELTRAAFKAFEAGKNSQGEYLTYQASLSYHNATIARAREADYAKYSPVNKRYQISVWKAGNVVNVENVYGLNNALNAYEGFKRRYTLPYHLGGRIKEYENLPGGRVKSCHIIKRERGNIPDVILNTIQIVEVNNGYQ